MVILVLGIIMAFIGLIGVVEGTDRVAPRFLLPN